MKVDRHCPRCRFHGLHWVDYRHVNSDDMRSLLDYAPEEMPYRIEIQCCNCSHVWRGRLTREERGFDVAA